MSLYFSDNYTQLCSIEADFSQVPLLPQSKATGTGSVYIIEFEIILLFGTTELKAQIAWKENVSFYLSYAIQSNRFRINFTCGFREKRNGNFF
jgi:hypothetical protein